MHAGTCQLGVLGSCTYKHPLASLSRGLCILLALLIIPPGPSMQSHHAASKLLQKEETQAKGIP